MKVHVLYEKGITIEYLYSPLFEMLCALHVLCNPEHHLGRIKWAKDMKNNMSADMCERLKSFDDLTDQWLIVMDFCNLYNVCNDLDVNGALQYMKDLPIRDFKKIFLQYETIDIKKITKDFQIDMIETLAEFYNEYFCRELLYIEQLLIRTLKKDVAVGQKNGIWNYIDNIHSRLEVTDKAILFHKHTLYTVPIETLKLIKIRISSFINPHLLMDYSEDSVQVTRMVHVEKREDIVPDDLTKLLKALSDETRLKILRKFYRGRESTSSLAEMLKLTEACISKHLKLLYDAELLQREREGNYIYYSLDTSMLDRIPLFMYEYLA